MSLKTGLNEKSIATWVFIAVLITYSLSSLPFFLNNMDNNNKKSEKTMITDLKLGTEAQNNQINISQAISSTKNIQGENVGLEKSGEPGGIPIIVEQDNKEDIHNEQKEIKTQDDVDKEILLAIIQNVKDYNTLLNQKQSETLQIFVYILGFISLVAGFFGYRTLRDIKDNAQNEMQKVANYYSDNFKLLEEQAKLGKDMYEMGNKVYNIRLEDLKIMVSKEKEEIISLSSKIKEQQLMVETNKRKLEEMAERYKYIDSIADIERKQKDEEIEAKKESAANGVLNEDSVFED